MEEGGVTDEWPSESESEAPVDSNLTHSINRSFLCSQLAKSSLNGLLDDSYASSIMQVSQG